MEIRLDYLQNPPLDKALTELINPNFTFSSIADKEHFERVESARNALKKHFGKQYALPFSFTSSGFVELFLQFKKIYFLPTLHYEIRRALEIVRPFVALQEITDLTKNLDSTTNKDSTLFIAPLINEDIFSVNQIPEIRNATLALDISYALALGLEIERDKANILLVNATPLGLPRDFGLIIADKIYTSTIHRNGVSEAFLGAINERRAKKFSVDLSYGLFEKLKSLFGKDIDLFTRDFAPQTLPLRLRHINTRYLIEHLYLDNIFIQASQDCALGFIKPSYTLLSLGFSPKQARELCAVSFEVLENADLVAQKIFESYKMIRLMEF